jgi:hypothetical protein
MYVHTYIYIYTYIHAYVFSSNHVSFMFCSTQMLGHIVLPNNSTTLADYSSVSFMSHDV